MIVDPFAFSSGLSIWWTFCRLYHGIPG